MVPTLMLLSLPFMSACQKAEAPRVVAEPVIEAPAPEGWDQFVTRQIEAHIANHPQWAVFQGYAGIMDEYSNPDESLKKPMGYYSALYGASGLQPSSAFVDDASFIKLRELSLAYRFTRDELNAIPLIRGLSGLTLSAVGRNVWTHTNYDGYDPDVGSTGGGTGSAVLARVDGYSYPNFRTLTLGVEITF